MPPVGVSPGHRYRLGFPIGRIRVPAVDQAQAGGVVVDGHEVHANQGRGPVQFVVEPPGEYQTGGLGDVDVAPADAIAVPARPARSAPAPSVPTPPGPARQAIRGWRGWAGSWCLLFDENGDPVQRAAVQRSMTLETFRCFTDDAGASRTGQSHSPTLALDRRSTSPIIEWRVGRRRHHPKFLTLDASASPSASLAANTARGRRGMGLRALP